MRIAGLILVLSLGVLAILLITRGRLGMPGEPELLPLEVSTAGTEEAGLQAAGESVRGEIEPYNARLLDAFRR